MAACCTDCCDSYLHVPCWRTFLKISQDLLFSVPTQPSTYPMLRIRLCTYILSAVPLFLFLLSIHNTSILAYLHWPLCNRSTTSTPDSSPRYVRFCTSCVSASYLPLCYSTPLPLLPAYVTFSLVDSHLIRYRTTLPLLYYFFLYSYPPCYVHSRVPTSYLPI